MNSQVLVMDQIKWNPSGSRLQRVWDSVQKGLNVRFYPTGKKVFYLRYTEHGKQRLRKIGAYPALSLKNARFDAAEIRAKAKAGVSYGRRSQATQSTLSTAMQSVPRKTI